MFLLALLSRLECRMRFCSTDSLQANILYKKMNCSPLMQHCEVHYLQVGSFGFKCHLPAERLQIPNNSRICRCQELILQISTFRSGIVHEFCVWKFMSAWSSLSCPPLASCFQPPCACPSRATATVCSARSAVRWSQSTQPAAHATTQEQELSQASRLPDLRLRAPSSWGATAAPAASPEELGVPRAARAGSWRNGYAEVSKSWRRLSQAA